MKYFFTAIFGCVAVCLTLILGWSLHLAFTDSAYWWLVSLGILPTNVVSVLITTAAYIAAREY